jgi:hypothetical protein
MSAWTLASMDASPRGCGSFTALGEVAHGSRSGMLAATVVPPPGGLCTRSSPFIAATRS